MDAKPSSFARSEINRYDETLKTNNTSHLFIYINSMIEKSAVIDLYRSGFIFFFLRLLLENKSVEKKYPNFYFVCVDEIREKMLMKLKC